MLNLTPHTITIETEEGTVVLPPTGNLARVAMTLQSSHTIEIQGVEVPVVERRYGQLKGMPKFPEPCIISSIAAMFTRGRDGVFTPDTGPTASRDERGRILAVRRLIKA